MLIQQFASDEKNSMEQREVFTKHIPGRAKALRDFFLACNASLFAKAYRSLATVVPQSAPAVNDWDRMEFAFNRLFIGPGPVVAPPYASVYIDKEPFVMGQTTLKVRRFYKILGLSSYEEGIVPDDHISLELGACICIHEGLRKSYSTQL